MNAFAARAESFARPNYQWSRVIAQYEKSYEALL
jgi:hypothetical protein